MRQPAAPPRPRSPATDPTVCCRRVAGVASKVSRLVACAAPGRRLPPALHDPLEWETKTLTSALKSYLRALPDPLLTRALHDRFIAVVSQYTAPRTATR